MMDSHMGFDPARAARFAGLGALVLVLSWQHVQATRLGYQVESARKRARALRGQVEDLRLKLDEGLSPSALARSASTRLRMVPATPHELRALPATTGARGPLLWARALVPFVSRS